MSRVGVNNGCTVRVLVNSRVLDSMLKRFHHPSKAFKAHVQSGSIIVSEEKKTCTWYTVKTVLNTENAKHV